MLLNKILEKKINSPDFFYSESAKKNCSRRIEKKEEFGDENQ